MIRLTIITGITIYINPDFVIGINESASWSNYEGTMINYGHDSYLVKESPEEVARKVLEYRLKMEEHKAWIRSTTHHVNDNDTYDLCDNHSLLVERELYRLAGLEEQKDE